MDSSRKVIGDQRSAPTMERARFNEISNVFEPDHWMIAPFAPDHDGAAPHASGRPLYSYSTRWVLATNFRNTIFADGAGIHPLFSRINYDLPIVPEQSHCPLRHTVQRIDIAFGHSYIATRDLKLEHRIACRRKL